MERSRRLLPSLRCRFDREVWGRLSKTAKESFARTLMRDEWAKEAKRQGLTGNTKQMYNMVKEGKAKVPGFWGVLPEGTLFESGVPGSPGMADLLIEHLAPIVLAGKTGAGQQVEAAPQLPEAEVINPDAHPVTEHRQCRRHALCSKPAGHRGNCKGTAAPVPAAPLTADYLQQLLKDAAAEGAAAALASVAAMHQAPVGVVDPEQAPVGVVDSEQAPVEVSTLDDVDCKNFLDAFDAKTHADEPLRSLLSGSIATIKSRMLGKGRVDRIEVYEDVLPGTITDEYREWYGKEGRREWISLTKGFINTENPLIYMDYLMRRAEATRQPPYPERTQTTKKGKTATKKRKVEATTGPEAASRKKSERVKKMKRAAKRLLE